MTLPIVVLFICILFQLIKSDWRVLSPPNVFIIFYTLQVLVVRVFFLPVNWLDIGFMYILISFLLFFYSYRLGLGKLDIKVSNTFFFISVKSIRLIQHFSTCLGISSSIYLIYSLGIDFRLILSVSGLLSINNQIAVLRYTSWEFGNWVFSLLRVFVFVSPLLTGFLFSYDKRLFSGLSGIVPAILVVGIENTKATLIGALILWASAWIGGGLVFNKEYPKVTRRIMIITVLSLLCVFSFLVLSMILRTGSIDRTSLNQVKEKIGSYAIGHMIAFDFWFNDYLFQDIKYTLGKYTFYSIFDYLNLSDRVSGIYTDYTNFNGIQTNVYTVFRGLITDFGIFGSLFFIWVSGYITGYCTQSVIRDKFGKIYYLLFIIIITTFYLYYIISIFTYTTFILAFAIFGIIIFATSREKGYNIN